MGHQESGSGTSYPASFLVPDDGDPKTASSVNIGLEALGDRTEYLRTHSPRLKAQTFTSTGSWVCPARVTTVKVIGVGGGGAGGAGVAGATALDGGSGSGGGGAKQGTGVVTVIPGTTYSVTIGAGGPSSGSAGGDSTFQGLTFYGAAGGIAPTATDSYQPGGRAIRDGVTRRTQTTIGEPPGEGQGGWSLVGNIAGIATNAPAPYRTGGHSPVARGAAPGTDSGASGGVAWAGGGGGASGFPGNVAGVGGSAAGAPAGGAAGTAGTLGAGGGGGTAGAWGSGTAGAGGAGGAGAITLIWAEDT